MEPGFFQGLWVLSRGVAQSGSYSERHLFTKLLLQKNFDRLRVEGGCEAGALRGKDLADLGVRVCGLWCCLKLTTHTLWFSLQLPACSAHSSLCGECLCLWPWPWPPIQRLFQEGVRLGMGSEYLRAGKDSSNSK